MPEVIDLPTHSPEIIVCGLGRTGYRIFSLLKQQGAKVIGISSVPLAHGEAGVLVGNLRSPELLRRAGIEQARTLVLACSDDPMNLAIMTQARLLNPRIRIVNRLFNTSLGERLDQTLPHHVSLSVAALSAPLFSFAALGSRAVGQISLLGYHWPIYVERIGREHSWNGRSLGSLWENQGRMLIHYQPRHGFRDLVSAVVDDVVLEPGDELVMAVRPRSRRIRARRWRWLQRRLLLVLKQLRRRGRVALGVLLLLLFTIGLATGVYLSTQLNTSFADALYFAVGMITGAGGQEQVAENAADSIKYFTVVMMLVGAGIIGVGYALLNDFVLGVHLQDMWNVARLPAHHHYIICGLGGVGYSIARNLQRMGYEVVVLERDPNGRFVSAARALKIPVIVGDASLSSALSAANVEGAAALLAVTSDDTVNLEIALTAKGMAPRLTVVVRNQDADFAWQIQQVFQFEHVMSPMDLATPAFAAAALGGRILGSAMVEERLWVAIATPITASHVFCGQSIQHIAQTTELVPLYIETQGRTLHGLDLLQARLASGDVLYLTIPAHRLEQLWRHDSAKVQAPF